MVRRLLAGGHEVVAFNRSEAPRLAAMEAGAEGAATLDEAVGKLASPRAVWVMMPSGETTERFLLDLADRLAPGDILIDGANSYYRDTVRRAEMLTARGLRFVDVGTSGGIWGETEGYSLMIGGDDATVAHLTPIFQTLAPAADLGWGHVGTHGAGHFVKMVHNGIEYGMMQAFAEGFELMAHKEEYGFDLHQISEIWRHGSVVRSWLLDLTARALEENPTLQGIAPHVADSGEGRWTAREGIDLGVALPVITLALQRRFITQDESPFSGKVLAAMRQQFGGHAVKREGE
jgi:6-phosphogluconate dehydrogenase